MTLYRRMDKIKRDFVMHSDLEKILESVRKNPRYNLEQISKDSHISYETVCWYFHTRMEKFKEALVDARNIQKQQENANAVADGGWSPHPSEY